MEKGFLTHPADGYIGSVLACGFLAWTEGTLSLIDSVGIRTFVAGIHRRGPRGAERTSATLFPNRRGSPESTAGDRLRYAICAGRLRD
jgi:hypothetical protein